MTVFRKQPPGIKVHPVVDGWAIRCPACAQVHVMRGWDFNGNKEKPSFAPSLKVTSMNAKCEVTAVCHSNIINGEFHYANDCTHALKGQVVPVPDWTPV